MEGPCEGLAQHARLPVERRALIRPVAALLLWGAVLPGFLLAGCAGGASRSSGKSAERPPAPRLGDEGEGRDPLEEPASTVRRKTPLPPIADPGELPAASGLPSGSGEGQVLYVVGERRITEASLGDFLLRYFPDRTRDPLGQLVDEALVELAAGRSGVTVDDAEVAARAAEHIEARRQKVRVEYGAEASLEEMLATSFGRTIEEFERDARRLSRIALLRDRIVRFEQLRADRVEVRALTFPDEKSARNAVERLRGGADMTLLARRMGLRDPVAPPPFARDEITPPERSAEVFAAEAGTVLDARPFGGKDGKTWFEVIKVVSRLPASGATWAEVRDAVVAGLGERPVGVPEYLAWRRRAIRTAKVEVRRAGRGLVPWLPDTSGDDAGTRTE